MGIHSLQASVMTHNVRYSAFLGMLYVSTPESEALIKEAKSLVGEVEVKKGYQGNWGESSSAKAISWLKERGIGPIKMSGSLTSARVIDRNVDGRLTPYLTVGLRDENGRYFLSVDMSQPAAQMLARKLANADVGVETELALFATYRQRQGAARAFADHGATLKQGGTEIKSVDPREALVPRVSAALKALEDAGVSKDDKETFARRRAKVEMEFHSELMEKVNDKFSAFYASTEQPDPEADDDTGNPLKDAA
jgi:hypothetical protein